MADPISISSGIAGLLALAVTVAEASYRYVSDVRTATVTVSSYLQELSALKAVLFKLDELAHDPELMQNLVSTRSPMLSEMDIRGCQSELEVIHGKLLKRLSGSKISTKFGRLTWPFVQQETLGYVQTFQRYRSIFHTALSCDTLQVPMTVGHVALKEVKALSQGLQEGSRIPAVIEWLCPDSFDGTHAAVKGQHQEGTGQWFIAKMSEWLSETGSTPFVWCRGIPGAGKTVLMSMVIDHVVAKRSDYGISGVAYIYFNYKQRECQTISSILASLIAQMLRQVPEVQPLAERMYHDLDGGKRTPSDEQILGVLADILQSHKIFLAFDAMDEASTSARNGLVSRFASLEMKNLRIFMTSRPDVDFKCIITRTKVVDIAAQSSDLEIFARTQLESNNDVRAILEDCNQDIVSEIIGEVLFHAAGMFLLVVFQIDYICRQTSAKEMLDASRAMPSNPGSIYAHTLEQIYSQSASQVQLAKRVLCWLVLAKRNLYLTELTEAIATEVGTTELDPLNRRSATILVKVCRGLVVLDEEIGIIRLAHLTVHDFLASSLPDLARMRVEICLVSLTYLSFAVFRQGPCISKESFLNRMERHRFYLYATEYLSDHIRDAGDDSLLAGPLLLFAQSKPVFESYLQGLYHIEYHVYTSGYDFFPRDSTPLHIAARLGHEGLLRQLLEQNLMDIEALDSSCTTPMLIAVERGYEPLVRMFLKIGASASVESGDTALNCAARERHDGIVRLLLQGRSSTEPQLPCEAQDLFVAAIAGDEEKVDSLLELGVDPDEKDSDGGTALQWAAWYGHELIVMRLIGHGAEIEAEDKKGRRAIHEASERGYVRVVKTLLESGAQIDAQDSFGLTPLHRAVWKGGIRTTLLLLNAGSDIHLLETRGFSALDLAVGNGDCPMVKLLLEAGAAVENFDFSRIVYEPGVTNFQYNKNKRLVKQAMEQLEEEKIAIAKARSDRT